MVCPWYILVCHGLIDNSNTTKIETSCSECGNEGTQYSLIDNSNTTKIETVYDISSVWKKNSLIDNSNTTKIETKKVNHRFSHTSQSNR